MRDTINSYLQYNRYFSNAIMLIAKKEYSSAKSYLMKAAKALNDSAKNEASADKEFIKSWIIEVLREIKNLEEIVYMERINEIIEGADVQPDEKISRFALKEIPNTTFDDIAGLEEVKEAILYKVIYPRKYPELYETFKKRTGGGVLLYGLPGTGKTLIAEAIAHETNATFFPIKCSDLGSKWFGETEKNIREVFADAKKAQNAVIFFDEIEAYASNRRDNSTMERTVPEFLQQMQGIGASNEHNKILVIGATNKPWRLDGAFLRPGRFDEKIYVPLPNNSTRQQIIESRLKEVPYGNLNISEIVELTNGYNCADVDYLCEKAKESAIKRIINSKGERNVIQDDFTISLKLMKTSVLEIDKKEMNNYVRAIM